MDYREFPYNLKPVHINMIVGILCTCFIIFLFAYRSQEVQQVHGVEWNRRIEVQRYTTVIEDGWSIPTGGRYIREYRAIHHYESRYVGSHTERYSCGTTKQPRTCTRTVSDYENFPVYRTKYEYEIDKWIVNRSLMTSGHDYKPVWPNTDDLRYSNGMPRIGDEQLGNRYEVYTIFLRKDTGLDRYTCRSFNEYTRYHVGDRVITTKNILGWVLAIELMK